jgi:hypothetical protein
MKSTDGKDKPIIVSLINKVKQIYKDTKNILYSVCSGISIVFAIANTGIGLPPPILIQGFFQLSLL